MIHLKTYQQINESKSNEFELLVEELISEMTNRNIISFDDLHIDGELIKIEELCSIWIMETGMICYYPGEHHAMIVVSSPSEKDEDIHRMISYPKGLAKVEKNLKKKIRRLKDNTIKNKVEGNFPLKYPDFSYKEPQRLKIDNLKPETIKILRDILKDMNF